MELPELFILRTKSLLGDAYPDFEQALQVTSPVSVRVNNKLRTYMPSDQKVPWCKAGYYLDQRPLFTADPLLHAGVYYVQEASSMFLQHVVEEFFGEVETVLDLCAAPGGKSTLISEALHDDALLVSNELVRSRAMILAENVIKWGNPNVVVTNNQPDAFKQLPAFFDAVVVDAPCSGEGMFRKNPDSIGEWSLQNVIQCAIRQKNILQEVWDTLKPGGILVYSTCTYNREENEDNVAWICENLGAVRLKIDLKDLHGVVESDFGYRFYPHRIEGEGFFISVMRKDVDFSNHPKYKQEKGMSGINRSQDFIAKIRNAHDYAIIETDQFITAYPLNQLSRMMTLKKKLNCVVNGVFLAELKGKDVIPAHQFALSKILDTAGVNQFELDYKTAIAFLKRENIYLPDAPLGYVLVTFQQQALGWVKNLGKRCNNLYPQYWRIRMFL
ncbi:MAG: SAM-dependent methyltransferase [Paludibacter sp.]|nr:SAM-dependent methyltransferase [Paludibacter sp.]